MKPSVCAVTDPRFEGHQPTGFHPERPERLNAALRGLHKSAPDFYALDARMATENEILGAHSEQYLDTLLAALRKGTGQIDGDTYFSTGSQQAAWLAAGSGCKLIDALIDGEFSTGLLLARPPGHHATRDRAMGFCLLNNIAIASAHAKRRGVNRIAIVDWDVHHGNGTQDIFYHDPSVVFFSLHQFPLYPGTGQEFEVGDSDGKGTTVNIPLPRHSDNATYAAAFERIVLPILSEAKPELVLISAGFDAHVRDPLSNMSVDERGFGWMASALLQSAQSLGSAKIGVFFEGGYDLTAIEDSLAHTIEGLTVGGRVLHQSKTHSPIMAAEPILAETIKHLKPFWRAVL